MRIRARTYTHPADGVALGLGQEAPRQQQPRDTGQHLHLRPTRADLNLLHCILKLLITSLTTITDRLDSELGTRAAAASPSRALRLRLAAGRS